MSEKRPKWEEEAWTTIGASESIVCKTCILRPYEDDGYKINRANSGCCQIYEYPESKPNDVYFDGALCEYYVAE